MARVHNGEPQKRERSKKWLEARIAYLTEKPKRLKFDYETRLANTKQELSERKAELKTLGK